VYVTDTAPLSRPGEGVAGGLEPNGRELQLIDLFRDADVVIFDTMFSLNEYLEKMTWGHSYPEYAYALCKAAGVKKLLLFHHAPDASDADLDVLAAAWSSATEPQVELAREGMEIVF
jgi:ribonuclease BN (tRNA processing enzyme)